MSSVTLFRKPLSDKDFCFHAHIILSVVLNLSSRVCLFEQWWGVVTPTFRKFNCN